jgi:cytochrome c oxidase subunit 4
MLHHVAPIKTYRNVFITLMVLLVLTVIAGHFHLGRLNIAVALTIAIIKALVVILYFMHVRWSSRVTWVFAGSAFLWLGIMLVLTTGDYATRGARPGQKAFAPAVVPPAQTSAAVAQPKKP